MTRKGEEAEGWRLTIGNVKISDVRSTVEMLNFAICAINCKFVILTYSNII